MADDAQGNLGADNYKPLDWNRKTGSGSGTGPTGPTGPPGTATFPITYDDGTYTYSITATGSLLHLKAFPNASPSDLVEFYLEADDGTASLFVKDGGLFWTPADGLGIFSDPGVDITTASGSVYITANGNEMILTGVTQAVLTSNLLTWIDSLGSITIGSSTTTNILIQPDGDVRIESLTGNILLPSLPTTDPGVPDALWNDSGTLKISP